MKTNAFQAAAAFALSALAFGAVAQDPVDPIAKVDEVSGLVTVSQKIDQVDQVISPVKGTRLADGNRVVTTTDGRITIVFNNDCRVELKANKSFVVRDEKDCKALIASVTSVGGVPATAVAGTAPGSSVGPWVLAGTGVAAILWMKSSNNDAGLSSR